MLAGCHTEPQGESMTPCPQTVQLERLLVEQLPEDERQAIEAHVETCPACQAELPRRVDEAASLLRPPAAAPGRAGTVVEQAGPLAELWQRLQAHAPVTPTGATLARTLPEQAGAASPEGLPGVPGYEVLRELGRGGMGVVYQA